MIDKKGMQYNEQFRVSVLKGRGNATDFGVNEQADKQTALRIAMHFGERS
jgi:hypothetical protein